MLRNFVFIDLRNDLPTILYHAFAWTNAEQLSVVLYKYLFSRRNKNDYVL